MPLAPITFTGRSSGGGRRSRRARKSDAASDPTSSSEKPTPNKGQKKGTSSAKKDPPKSKDSGEAKNGASNSSAKLRSNKGKQANDSIAVQPPSNTEPLETPAKATQLVRTTRSTALLSNTKESTKRVSPATSTSKKDIKNGAQVPSRAQESPRPEQGPSKQGRSKSGRFTTCQVVIPAPGKPIPKLDTQNHGKQVADPGALVAPKQDAPNEDTPMPDAPSQDLLKQDAIIQSATVLKDIAQKALTQSSPFQGIPAPNVPGQSAPKENQNALDQDVIMQDHPTLTNNAPVESNTVQNAISQPRAAQDTKAQKPVQSNDNIWIAPVQAAPVHNTPIPSISTPTSYLPTSQVQNTAVQEAPLEKALQNTPARNTPMLITSVLTPLAHAAAIQKDPLQHAPIQKTPTMTTSLPTPLVRNAAVENALVQNVIVHDNPIQKIPTSITPLPTPLKHNAAAQKAPIQEIPIQKTTVPPISQRVPLHQGAIGSVPSVHPRPLSNAHPGPPKSVQAVYHTPNTNLRAPQTPQQVDQHNFLSGYGSNSPLLIGPLQPRPQNYEITVGDTGIPIEEVHAFIRRIIRLNNIESLSPIYSPGGNMHTETIKSITQLTMKWQSAYELTTDRYSLEHCSQRGYKVGKAIFVRTVETGYASILRSIVQFFDKSVTMAESEIERVKHDKQEHTAFQEWGYASWVGVQYMDQRFFEQARNTITMFARERRTEIDAALMKERAIQKAKVDATEKEKLAAEEARKKHLADEAAKDKIVGMLAKLSGRNDTTEDLNGS